MDAAPALFVPAAPRPRAARPSPLEAIRIIFRNPLELWTEAVYEEPYVAFRGLGGPLVLANDPKLVRHILVDNARNYRMGETRQMILRPIMRDGLVTAEGNTWKRARKALAPVFTPRSIQDFGPAMLRCADAFADRFTPLSGGTVDIDREMSVITYNVLLETLFSGEIADEQGNFGHEVDRLLQIMGRFDPLDMIRAPAWLPRITRYKGRRYMADFRRTVDRTIRRRLDKMERGDLSDNDFLALLLRAQGPDGLTADEVEDNIVAFIGAGHETTARALAWTVYCLAEAPWEREPVEREIEQVMAREPDPVRWLDAMPLTRAAFEEAMRLFPPAPIIGREPIEDDAWGDLRMPAGTTVSIMPWTLHRHRKLWDKPDTYLPERFHPGNREKIDRFQYLPFGAGPRICIGASFAQQEMIIVLARLLSRFRFDTLPETRPWPVQKVTVQPEGGLPMRVSSRA